MPVTAGWRIDRCTSSDLGAVWTLESEAVGGGRPRELLERELEHEFAHIDVLRSGGEVVGFSNYWVVADEVHLLTIATAPQFRRRGIARRLLTKLVEDARADGLQRVTLEVRVSNHAAQQLYLRFGFSRVGVRRAYYHDGEDAEVLLLQL